MVDTGYVAKLKEALNTEHLFAWVYFANLGPDLNGWGS